MAKRRRRKRKRQYHRITSLARWLLLVALAVGLLLAGWWLVQNQDLWRSPSQISRDEKLVMAIVRRLPEDPQTIELNISILDQNQWRIIKIPNLVKLNLGYGYGSWPAGSLLGLVEQENKPELISQAASDLFSAPIEWWLIYQGQGCTDQFECWQQTAQSWWKQKGLETNLSRRDFWLIKQRLSDLTSVNFDYIDASQGSWAQPLTEVDGKNMIVFSPEFVAARVSDWFNDPQILQENLAVEVINTTQVNGAGEYWARLLSGLGLRVIRVDSASDNQARSKQCLIRGKSTWLSSWTVQRLQRIWQCEFVSAELDNPLADLQFRIGPELARQKP